MNDSFEKIKKSPSVPEKINLKEDRSILDSRSNLESIILKIPSSHHIEEFREKIVEMFNN